MRTELNEDFNSPEQKPPGNSYKEKILKALLRSFILCPYRITRIASDRLIKLDFKDFFARDVQNMKGVLQNFGSLLDVGSGYGYLGEALQEAMPEALIVNTDIVNNHQGNTKFVLADGTTLPFTDNSFDVVTLFYVLHHTDKSREVLQEARRVSSNRVVVQEDVYSNAFEHLVSWLHMYTWQPDVPLSSIKVQSDQEWRKLFEEEGFTVKNKRPIHMAGLPITRYEYLLEQR